MTSAARALPCPRAFSARSRGGPDPGVSGNATLCPNGNVTMLNQTPPAAKGELFFTHLGIWDRIERNAMG